MKKVVYVLVIIFSMILPYLLDSFLNIIYKWGIIGYCDIDSYFTFYASFLSGLITLVGVIITLRSEDKQKQIDDSIKYKPILRVEGIDLDENCLLREVHFGMGFSSSNNDPKREEKCEKFYKQTMPENPLFRLFIKNIGRGETSNAVLEKAEVKNISWDNESNLSFSGGWNQYVGEICVNELLGIDFYLPEYLFITENLKGRKYHEMSFEIFINYNDMFNRIKYQEIIHIKLRVDIVKIDKELPYFYKEGFEWAKVRYSSPLIMPIKNIYSVKDKEYIHESYVKLNKPKKKKINIVSFVSNLWNKVKNK